MGNSWITISSRWMAGLSGSHDSRKLMAGLSGVLANGPPSQYHCLSTSVMGKPGGRLSLATTCSKERSWSELSKYLISAVLRSIAPTITRLPPWLSLSRSANSARVRRSGPVS
jgi:hypothetical protein